MLCPKRHLALLAPNPPVRVLDSREAPRFPGQFPQFDDGVALASPHPHAMEATGFEEKTLHALGTFVS